MNRPVFQRVDEWDVIIIITILTLMRRPICLEEPWGMGGCYYLIIVLTCDIRHTFDS